MNRPSLALSLLAALALPALTPLTRAAHAAEAQPESVVMDLETFLKLYEAGRKLPEVPTDVPKPPHAVTLPSARYEGSVVFDAGVPTSVVWKGVISVDVLASKEWQRIPLLPDTVALRSASIGGKPAPLVRAGDLGGWLTLVTERTGTFSVDVEFATSVFSGEGRSSLSFPIAPSAATQLSLAVPVSDDLDVTVGGARLQTAKVVGANRIIEALVPSSNGVSIAWQREIPDAPESAEPRLYAEVFSLVGIGDGLLSSRSTIAYTIQQAGVETLRVALPPDVALVDVSGAGIRNWAVTDDVLSVVLNYAAEGSYRMALQLERAVGAGNVSALTPLPKPLGVERSKGWVGVEALSAVELATGASKGMTPVDVRSLPAAILGITEQPVLLGFKYLGDDVELPLSVTAHEEVEVLVTLLDTARATTMFTPDGRRLTSVVWRVRNNRKQFLRLALPTGAELWSASVAGQAVQPARGADQRILIPLVRSQESGGALASFDVGVVYVEDGTAPDAAGRGSFRAALPTADVPITWVGWTVYAPENAKITRRSYDGSVRRTDWLKGPYGNPDAGEFANVDDGQRMTVQRGADAQIAGGGLGGGATPVTVQVPVQGQPVHFEKLLALGEELWVSFDYKGLKQR